MAATALSVEDRLRICELVESMVGADGVVSEEERAFLRRIVDRLGFTETEYGDRVVTSDPGRATALLRALAPDAQMRVMALLVDAAVVDGRVQPEERALLLASAATLGVDAAALEERIAQRLKSSTRPSG